jgi:glycosyltransferase involved in cell wall biosynthesis
MRGDEAPKVSVGLPVRNGEAFLAQAIESIVGQTFSDLELIIADNGSSDGTERICRWYAERDPRIRYSRNARDLGASPNHNLVFRAARGRYFKWAAHDDALEPHYLSTCVAALDAEPDAVLCHTLIKVIDGDGRVLGTHDSGLTGARSRRAPTRFLTLALLQGWDTEFFGLIRADALHAIEPLGHYVGCDRALLAELSLRGRFIEVHEPLFLSRHHPARYSAAVAFSRRAAWHDTDRRSKGPSDRLKLLAALHAMVRRHLPSLGERWHCYLHLLRWWFVNRNLARAIGELAMVVSPRLSDYAWAINRRRLARPPALTACDGTQ